MADRPDTRAPPAPDLFAALVAVEEGEDHAHCNGWITIPPPGTVVDSIPPTDIRMQHRGRIRGRNLERMHIKAVDRREADQQLRSRVARAMPQAVERWPDMNLNLLPRLRSIFVKPADPRRAVFDLQGRAYPVDGLSVSASDVYVQRRLRDGSLVRADPP